MATTSRVSITYRKSTCTIGSKGGEQGGEEEEFVDPFCRPDDPQIVSFEQVCCAAYKIKSGVVQTTCERSVLSDRLGMEVYFKNEFQQYTGSFKERGARYALLALTDEEKEKGVIAASAGNHAQALSFHGQDLGIPVTVVMPTISPIVKIDKCKSYGANVVVEGKDMTESKKVAEKMAKEKELMYINGYDHPNIIAGQGTIGLEIVEQVPEVDAVVVPVGGAGLIAGIAVGVKNILPEVQIIGAESEKCPSFSKAMEEGKPTKVDVESSIADGLAVGLVGYNAFATAKEYVDKTVLVKEAWISTAILRLLETERIVVEGAGAVGLAAAIGGVLDHLKGKIVVIVLSGSNMDMTVLGRCLEKALASEGRLIKVKVLVKDKPDGIADFFKLVASTGVTIKDVTQERAWVTSDIHSVEVTAICETRDHEHAKQLQNVLKCNYKDVKFSDDETPCDCLEKKKT